MTLIAEVVLLLALAFSVLFSGGGPDGMVPEAVNPLNAFKSLEDAAAASGLAIDGTTIAAGSAAIGVFFAFWSWVGFETTAVYGEESRNPRHIVPRATLIAVVGLGTFYTFVSWMMIAGNGKATAIEKANTDSIGLWVDLAEDKLGGVVHRRHLPVPHRDRVVRLRAGLPHRREPLPLRHRPRAARSPRTRSAARTARTAPRTSRRWRRA